MVKAAKNRHRCGFQSTHDEGKLIGDSAGSIERLMSSPQRRAVE
jgi:hypothetical protein